MPAAFEEAWAHSDRERSLNLLFTQLLFSEGAVPRNKTLLEGLVSLSIKSVHDILSVPGCSFSFTLPLLCAVGVSCYTCASTAAWVSWLQRRDQQLGEHQMFALCTPDGWDKAMSLNLLCLITAGSLIQSQGTQCLAGSHSAAPSFPVLCAIHHRDREKPHKFK